MYLIDSSIYIDAFRDGVDPVHRFSNEFEAGLITTCGVVVCEVLRGLRDQAVFKRMENFFGLLNSVPFNESLWERVNHLAWQLGRHGMVLPLSDILISAAALESNSIVVTADKHFTSVPELQVRKSVN